MSHNVLSIIYFVAFSHALMLAVALWRRSAPGSPARVLTLVVGLIAYTLFEGGAQYSGLFVWLAHGMDLLPAMVLWLGPLYYLYVRSVAGEQPFANWRWLGHFLPAVGMWLYNAPAVFSSSATKVAMWQAVLSASGDGVLPAVWVGILLAIKLHLGIYLALSWRVIRRCEQGAQQLRSDNSQLLLARMRATVVAFFLLEASWVGLFIGQQFFDLGTLNSVSQLWLLFVAVFVLALGYLGLQRPDLMFDHEERALNQGLQERVHASGDAGDKIKYLHSALPESTLDVLATTLEQRLQQDQLYLDDKLSLTSLAKATDIRAHTLSQVITQSMGSNFYRLINGYRVQHAVALIDKPNNPWSLERIALESGFANRVTFSKAFKEVMGCTPSAYRKRAQQPSRQA
jgi:AraC-like DNA-binding protein